MKTQKMRFNDCALTIIDIRLVTVKQDGWRVVFARNKLNNWHNLWVSNITI